MANDYKLITLLISVLKEQQTAIAESAVLRPSVEPLFQGITAGKYQGIQIALDAIDAVLRDDINMEKRS
jgi:hypothetical protein